MPIFSWEPVPGLPDIAQDASSTVTFIGSNVGDYIALGAHRDGNVGGVFKGSYNISLGDGNDKIGDGGFKNGDSVDMGAGDDTVELRINQNTHGPTGTPTISNFDMVKLDGGAGTDTLSFAYSVGDGSEITLSTGGAVNFENLIATSSAEIVRGDSGNNEINGGGGADTVYGGAGDDILLSVDIYGQGTNNNLYGEAGNDTLTTRAGDDILDGGAGADHDNNRLWF